MTIDAGTTREERPPPSATPEPPPLRIERAVLLAAARGDRAAFGRLYEAYAPLVHSVILAHALPSDADDLTQDVFVKAMRSISTLKDHDHVGAWLSQIARNEARQAGRARGRWILRLAGYKPTAAAAGAPQAQHQEEAGRALDAIRGLPEAYRETLLMRLVAGLTGPQIADLTGMTHGSVRVNLTRGMDMLRARLGDATATGAAAPAAGGAKP